jgi:hypothetical protein
MFKRFLVIAFLIIVTICLAGIAIYNLPPVHDRLAWRVETLRSQIYYALNPPEEAVFVPQEQQAEIEAIVRATMQALAPTVTPLPSPTLAPAPTHPGPTAAPDPTSTLTPTSTPIPGKVMLDGFVHEYQQMNNCGPATLAMLLSYWGWQGDQRDTRLVLRPNFAEYDDKNVMPSEMVSFIENHTGLKALVRVGGNLEILKRLIAAGFPVIVEKGFQPPKEAWMGHYNVINGYDDERQRFITQDSYIMPDLPIPYADLQDRWWRDFNYVYLVAYPPEREAELLALLGPDADPLLNYQSAAQLAMQETSALGGRDLFFAWFNLGTNLASLQDYPGAAQAYDQAFAVYAALPEDERPWRTLWYQVGPYQAYYATARYQDVINLANTTLSFLSKPLLEETLYWRGMAKQALGDLQGAISDYQKAVKINPASTAASAQLSSLSAAVP